MLHFYLKLFPQVLFADNNKITTLKGNALRLMESLDVIMLSKNPWPCECDLLKTLQKYKSKVRVHTYNIQLLQTAASKLSR